MVPKQRLIQYHSGAFSIVYKARDLSTGKHVAIKVVRKHAIDKVCASFTDGSGVKE